MGLGANALTYVTGTEYTMPGRGVGYDERGIYCPTLKSQPAIPAEGSLLGVLSSPVGTSGSLTTELQRRD